MAPREPEAAIAAAGRAIVLIGLMGAGKSCIGRRLAQRLNRPFIDADAEIEKAAGCAVEEIFERHGEAAFRDGERRVIARLLRDPGIVLATGGGAFMDPRTRAAVREGALSIWLRADLELLLRRTSRRNNRPLLKRGDPREILRRLMRERYPVYAEADVTVEIDDSPPQVTTERVCRAVGTHLDETAFVAGAPASGTPASGTPASGTPASGAGAS